MDTASLTPLEFARELDAEGRAIEAAQAYQHALAAGGAPLDAYLDLIGLYFEYLDPRWWDTLEYFHTDPDEPPAVTEDFLRTVADGLQRTLDRAEDEFGDHPELTFWREYTLFIHYDGEPFAELAEELLATGQTLVPALYLVVYGSPSVSGRYRGDAEQLLAEMAEGTTTRQRYLARILEQVLSDRDDSEVEDDADWSDL